MTVFKSLSNCLTLWNLEFINTGLAKSRCKLLTVTILNAKNCKLLKLEIFTCLSRNS
jgi:hypothetical protein